jgi:hypothetical protein
MGENVRGNVIDFTVIKAVIVPPCTIIIHKRENEDVQKTHPGMSLQTDVLSERSNPNIRSILPFRFYHGRPVKIKNQLSGPVRS